MPKRRLAVDETDKPSVTKSWLFTKFSNIENLNKPSKPIYVHTFETPVGKAISAADDCFVYLLAFEGSSMLDKRFPQICKELGVNKVLESSNSKLLKLLEHELKAYFDGDLQKFTVPIKYIGTQFQQDVWDKLTELPYGTTQTYGDLAKMMGVPASHSRAIGNACGNNALLVLVPCHRLVAAGSKGGYNSGKDRKEWLINHEKKNTESGGGLGATGVAAVAAGGVPTYLTRTERLAPLFPRLHTVRSRPLPADLRLAYESPQNLALELTKSILYEDADSIDITNLKSLDSLWNGKPQQYFESTNCGRPDSDKEYDSD